MVEIKTPAPVAPTPLPQRRPRVREVSSRYMSPSVSSSSSTAAAAANPDHHHHHHHHLAASTRSPLPRPTPSDFPPKQQQQRRSSSVQKQRSSDSTTTTATETDENRPAPNVRSSENLLGYHSKAMTQPRPVAVKLFKDKGGGREEIQRTRSDTPVLTTTDRGSLIRLRRENSCNLSTESAAAKLLYSSGLSSGRGPSPRSSPAKGNASTATATTSSFSSVSRSFDCGNKLARESTDSLCSVETSSVGSDEREFEGDYGKPSCARSLTLTSSSGHEGSLTVTSSLNLKSSLNYTKTGCLPPMPPPHCGKVGGEVKKVGGRKSSSHQDDMYRLKMLQNHYLQWRLANAKAEASMNAQKRESETKLYSLAVKLSELQDSVQQKRAELRYLQNIKALSTILESQMPYLDEWSVLEEDYSSALSDTTQCLQNVSSQLPVAGNLKADVKEMTEALNSSVKAIDSIFLQVENFIPRAEQVGSLVSEMARVLSAEQALFQECGVMLSKTHNSQVAECSMRGQIIQFHQRKLTC